MIHMFVPDKWTFDTVQPTWLVLHKTAGFETAQDCAAWFVAGADGTYVSAHYVIGLDGTVIQCVSESRGAGANCCTDPGYAAYLPAGVNLNGLTISIEHIDPAQDNSTPVTQAQASASFRLIGDICSRTGIPARPGDASGGIIGHRDIAPVNRLNCPGNYPWAALWAYLKGRNTMIPQGWNDNGTTLVAPNGAVVQHGFRDYVLSHAWEAYNIPITGEYGANGGTTQTFACSELEWSPATGVRLASIGDEIQRLRARVPQDVVKNAISLLQSLL